jgi:predicted site-specific integrase-resolvase
MPKNIGNIKLYSLEELSKTLEITTITLRTYIKQGKLKGRKAGGRWFVSEESLSEYFNPKPDGTKASPLQ